MGFAPCSTSRAKIALASVGFEETGAPAGEGRAMAEVREERRRGREKLRYCFMLAGVRLSSSLLLSFNKNEVDGKDGTQKQSDAKSRLGEAGICTARRREWMSQRRQQCLIAKKATRTLASLTAWITFTEKRSGSE